MLNNFENDLKGSSNDDKAELFIIELNRVDANVQYANIDEFIDELRNGRVSLEKSFGYVSRLPEASFDNDDIEYLVKDTKGFKEYADGVYLGYPFVTLAHDRESLYLEMQVYIAENHDLEETKEFFEKFEDVSINGTELSYDQLNYDLFMKNEDAFSEYKNKNVLYKDTMFTIGLYMNSEELWDDSEIPDDVDLSYFFDIKNMIQDNKTPDITLDINGEKLILDERISKTPVEHDKISNLYEIKNNFNIEPKIVEN